MLVTLNWPTPGKRMPIIPLPDLFGLTDATSNAGCCPTAAPGEAAASAADTINPRIVMGVIGPSAVERGRSSPAATATAPELVAAGEVAAARRRQTISDAVVPAAAAARRTA